MLRADQIADLSILINNPKHLHLSEPGTGKTPTICTYQRYLWDTHGTPSIWAMPKSLLEKNYDEAMTWGGWAPGEVVVVDGELSLPATPNAKVFLMGFRRFSLEWEKFPPHWRAIQIDEFHKGFGGAESEQTQALVGFMQRQGEFFTPMTGTLINGKLETAFPAIDIIEPRYYGNFKSFCHFHRMIDPFTSKLIGYREHAHLQTILQKHGIRRLFSDIFGHQEIVQQLEWLSMADEQRVIYDKFEEEALLELETFFVEGKQPGVAFIRARQIMEHPNRFPNLIGQGYLDILDGEPNAKLERLELHYTDHIERRKPLIVYAALVPQQHECLHLAQKAGMRVGYIGGHTSPTERARIDHAFRHGELDTIICSPQIADTGFNWQFSGAREVDHMIFVSLDYTDTTYIQAMHRTIRQKRSTPLRVTVMVYKNSIDNRMLTLIARKSRDANRVDPTREVVEFAA